MMNFDRFIWFISWFQHHLHIIQTAFKSFAKTVWNFTITHFSGPKLQDKTDKVGYNGNKIKKWMKCNESNKNNGKKMSQINRKRIFQLTSSKAAVFELKNNPKKASSFKRVPPMWLSILFSNVALMSRSKFSLWALAAAWN